MAFQRKWGAPQHSILLTTLSVFLLSFPHTLATSIAPSPAPSPTSALVHRNTTFIEYIADFVCGADNQSFFSLRPFSINSSSCMQFTAWSYKVSELPDVNCVFSTYDGLGCQEKDLDQQHVYNLERGNGTVCVYGGVVDGGKWYDRSGCWVCED